MFYIPLLYFHFFYYSILRPSHYYCYYLLFMFTSSRSFRLLRYFRLSFTRQIPLLASICTCLRGLGRASTANGNILFTPFCLSSLNSAARLSARFLFLFSLRSRERLRVSMEIVCSEQLLSFLFIFDFCCNFFSLVHRSNH